MNTKGRRQARLRDIAQRAGVSVSTVSRALNDSDKINADTKALIQSLADEANYGIRRHGRAYSSPSRHTIALVLPRPHGQDSRISEAFFLDLIGGIGDALREERCDLLISHQSPSDHDSLHSLFSQLNADGVVFAGQSDLHDEFNALADTQTPFVVWGAQLPDQSYPVVGGDNFAGGARLTRHLLRLGRRRIIFLGDIVGPEIALRYEGYCAALAEAGEGIEPRILPTDFHLDSAQERVELSLLNDPPFDAVVAGNDIAAIGAMRALASHGLKVPEDVSVVGYDDIRIAAFANPALTTIRQDVSRAGRALVSKILQRLKGESVHSTILPAELVVRESCGG